MTVTLLGILSLPGHAVVATPGNCRHRSKLTRLSSLRSVCWRGCHELYRSHLIETPFVGAGALGRGVAGHHERPASAQDTRQQLPPPRVADLEAGTWDACGDQLLGGAAHQQYASAATLTAAAASEVEVVFSLVTNSRPHTVRRVVENLLSFTTEQSWVALHLGKEPAVPYDKRDADYRWLLAQDRVQINSVRLSTTSHHGSELWAHMHNYRLVREGQQHRHPQKQRFFVFASELHTVLRPGLEWWISQRQASIPEGGVPIVLPGQAALFQDVTRWHEIRPASWCATGPK